MEPDVCAWCTNNIPMKWSEFCSRQCNENYNASQGLCIVCESQAIEGSKYCGPECSVTHGEILDIKAEELERYLEWYNDYMAGYDVPSYEKIRKRNKREEA